MSKTGALPEFDFLSKLSRVTVPFCALFAPTAAVGCVLSPFAPRMFRK